MDIAVAVGTWALAVGTWVLVFVTYRQAREQLSQVDRLTKQQLSLVEGQLSTARAQVKIALYLELRKEFDSELVDARKLLARQLLDSTPHDAINEPVMNFFEDMAMLVSRDYLDREMLYATFSYYATKWWAACKDYIAKERADKRDNSLFSDFEKLVETIYTDEMKERHKTRTELEASPLELKRFLEEEARL
jgi:hypothetical protein